MAEVIVAVASFRRPEGLRRLLDAVARLETSAQVSVVVVENDSERREALAVCEQLCGQQYRWPLTCVVAEERGIAQARNAGVEYILARSRAEFVAMLDDDEWPDAQWLDAFLHVQRLTGADALQGAVIPKLERTAGRWARQCHGIAPVQRETGLIPSIDSTSNVFVRRACLEKVPKPCFDPDFALSGGEDRDFFERLRRQGRRFAWVNDAVVYAWVPASRARFAWALKRAYRTGNSDMRVFLKHRPGTPQLAREIVKIAGAALVYAPLALISMPFVRRQAHALCKLCRAAGKTAALAGHRYDEYATVHGR
ncbi:MAG TPA: glycosyltransferase [Rhizomicrobium sp.]|nr:glycosyltransferase [Rhizomicrobium sp.]